MTVSKAQMIISETQRITGLIISSPTKLASNLKTIPGKGVHEQEKNKVISLTTRISELTKANTDIKNQLDLATKQLTLAKNQKKEDEQKITDLSKQINSLGTQLSDVQTKLNQASNLKQEAELKAETLSKQIQVLEAQLHAAQESLTLAGNQKKEDEQKISQLSTGIKTLETELDAAREELVTNAQAGKQAEIEAKNLLIQVESLENQLEETRDLLKLANETKKEDEEKIRGFSKHLARLESMLDEEKENNASVTLSKDEFLRELEKTREENEILRRELESLKSRSIFEEDGENPENQAEVNIPSPEMLQKKRTRTESQDSDTFDKKDPILLNMPHHDPGLEFSPLSISNNQGTVHINITNNHFPHNMNDERQRMMPHFFYSPVSPFMMARFGTVNGMKTSHKSSVTPGDIKTIPDEQEELQQNGKALFWGKTFLQDAREQVRVVLKSRAPEWCNIL